MATPMAPDDRISVPYGVGDLDVLISLLAKLSATPAHYIEELVDNSLDSIWFTPEELALAKYLITVTINRQRRFISVKDNAYGITFERMQEIPSQIGGSLHSKRAQAISEIGSTSRKGRIARMRGVFQVGLHGWESIGTEVYITSTSAEAYRETYTLMMAKDPSDPGGLKKLTPEISRERVGAARSGTEVHVGGIHPDSLRRLSIKSIHELLARVYRKDLSETKPRIEIELVEIAADGTEKQRVFVTPAQVQGIEFTLQRGRNSKFVQWVDAEGKRHSEELTITGVGFPNRTDGTVRILWGWKRVLRDITMLGPEFDCFPWNTGRLDLDITAGWLIPDANKKEFIDDPEGRLENFKRAIKEIERRVASFVKDKLDHQAMSRKINPGSKALSFVLEACLEKGFSLDGLSRRMVRQIGGDTDIYQTVRNRPNGNGNGNGAGQGNGNGNQPNGNGSKSPKTQDPHAPRRPHGSRPSIQVDEFPLLDRLDALYDLKFDRMTGDLQVIVINNAHWAYEKNVTPNPRSPEAMKYLIDVIAGALYEHYAGQELTVAEHVQSMMNMRLDALRKAGL